MGTVKAVLIGAFAALALIGCAKKEPILPGERENIREVLQTEARRAQAVETPVTKTLTPTPSVNHNVVFTYPKSEVLTRCSQISPLSPKAKIRTAATGITASAARIIAPPLHQLRVRRDCLRSS